MFGMECYEAKIQYLGTDQSPKITLPKKCASEARVKKNHIFLIESLQDKLLLSLKQKKGVFDVRKINVSTKRKNDFFINIPRIWLQSVGAKKGDSVIIEPIKTSDGIGLLLGLKRGVKSND